MPKYYGRSTKTEELRDSEVPQHPTRALAADAKKLTVFEHRFVNEFLVDLDPGKAAKRAGYKGRHSKSAGLRMLEQPRVWYAIVHAERVRSHSSSVTRERVIEELGRLAFSDITDVIEWNEKAVNMKDSSTLPLSIRAAIAEVSITKFGPRIRLHDKKGALDSLARYFGLFTDTVQVTGAGGEPLLPLEFVRQLVSAATPAIEVVVPDSQPALPTPDVKDS